MIAGGVIVFHSARSSSVPFGGNQFFSVWRCRNSRKANRMGERKEAQVSHTTPTTTHSHAPSTHTHTHTHTHSLTHTHTGFRIHWSRDSPQLTRTMIYVRATHLESLCDSSRSGHSLSLCKQSSSHQAPLPFKSALKLRLNLNNRAEHSGHGCCSWRRQGGRERSFPAPGLRGLGARVSSRKIDGFGRARGQAGPECD